MSTPPGLPLPDRPGGGEPLVYLVFGCGEAITADLLRRLHAAGFSDIRSAHDCVLRHLDEGGTRLSLLAGRAGLTKQAVGEHVDYLEERGYVTREPDRSDRRAKLVRPTPRGRQLRAAVLTAFADMEHEWEAAVGPDVLRAARATLQLIRGEASGCGGG